MKKSTDNEDTRLLLQEQFIPVEFISAEDRETLFNLGRSKTLDEILDKKPFKEKLKQQNS